jgi:hypothetical protein
MVIRSFPPSEVDSSRPTVFHTPSKIAPSNRPRITLACTASARTPVVPSQVSSSTQKCWDWLQASGRISEAEKVGRYKKTCEGKAGGRVTCGGRDNPSFQQIDKKLGFTSKLWPPCDGAHRRLQCPKSGAWRNVMRTVLAKHVAWLRRGIFWTMPNGLSTSLLALRRPLAERIAHETQVIRQVDPQQMPNASMPN